jgi:hypothetical protein
MEYAWFPMSDELYKSLWWWWNNRKFKNSPYVFVCDQLGQIMASVLKSEKDL